MKSQRTLEKKMIHKKKLKICILTTSFLYIACSSNNGIGVATISENSSADNEKEVLTEEDYPIVLTNCLNEKGYDLQTPFDIEDLKSTINQLSNSKEEQLQLREDVDYCISKYNLWSDSSSLNPEELAKIYDENLELAKCLREKGLNVPDPSQQEPKVDLSGLKESKDDIMPLLQECGWQK